MTTDKRNLYRTAQTLIRTARVPANAFVAITYDGFRNGNHWYKVTATDAGKLAACVLYSESQLTSFCL